MAHRAHELDLTMTALALATVAAAPVPAARIWADPRPLAVLGAGAALPGPPVSTAELLARIDARFGTTIAARGAAYADKLGVQARHTARDFRERREVRAPATPTPNWPPAPCAPPWTGRGWASATSPT